MQQERVLREQTPCLKMFTARDSGDLMSTSDELIGTCNGPKGHLGDCGTMLGVPLSWEDK